MKNSSFILGLLLGSSLLFSGCINSGNENAPAQDAQNVPAVSAEIDDEKLNKAIDEGIARFIAKQQAEEQKRQEEDSKPKFVEGVSVDDDPVLGDPNAPVTIIEFSDYECPFCKRHFEQVWPKLKENYVDTGKVKIVFRDYPLPFHDPVATMEAVAANCVREQTNDAGYFAFHDLLFTNTAANGKGVGDKLNDYAKEAGVTDITAFEACVEKNDTNEIKKDMADGQKYGISGTPAFLINGWALKGAYPYEAFQQLIEQELQK